MEARGIRENRPFVHYAKLIWIKIKQGVSHERGSRDADEHIVFSFSSRLIGSFNQSMSHFRSQLQLIGFIDRSSDKMEE